MIPHDVIDSFCTSSTFQESYRVAPNPHGRRLVITDIHGFYDTFLELLNQVGLSPDDQLFLLGDFIDKGKKSKEVLDLTIDLIEKSYKIFPLRGNHEDTILNAHHKRHSDYAHRVPILSRSKGLKDEHKNIYPKYLHFLEKLPYFYELDDFLLVHAGFDFRSPNPYTNYQAMMWLVDFEADMEQTNGKRIVHGHTKRSIDQIVDAVQYRRAVMGLDNATMLQASPKYGSLVCLDLDTYALYIQANID